MQMRTPGRRQWEIRHSVNTGFFISLILLAGALWFLKGRVELLEAPHNPHYEINHCFDCHEAQGSKMKAEECFNCHDRNDRTLRNGAIAKRQALVGDKKCSHPLKASGDGVGSITKLCLGCHKKVSGVVAMANIQNSEYVEIDMAVTHPIGLRPTETIFPKTLPLADNGAIDCITCHDQHALDRRLKLLRYYYPGNGHPADFRPLCLDCHPDGWLPLKLKVNHVKEARPIHKENN